MTNQEYPKDDFIYPIEYIKNKTEIRDNVLDDLELIKYQESNENQGIIEQIIQPKTVFGKRYLEDTCKYTTTNKIYLTDTQNIIQRFPKLEQSIELYDKVDEIWSGIINDDNFSIILFDI